MPRYKQTNQFSALSDPGKYTSGQGTKVFVSKSYLLNQKTPFREFTLVNAVNQGDVFITVAVGCDRILYEGTRIDFGTPEFPRAVFVATETPAGLTTIPIWKARPYIDAGATAKLEAYIPVFSAKTANADNQLQAFTDQNFSSYNSATRANGVSPQGSVAGVVVNGDPGHKMLTEASKQGKVCKIEIIDDFSHGGDWAEAHFGINKQRTVNQYNQVTYTIFPIRSWTPYTDPPDLLLTVDKTSVMDGDSFTVTLYALEGGTYPYTITGVDSADISGASLTGTFTGGVSSVTFTVTNDKKTQSFLIALDNGSAEASVSIRTPKIDPETYVVTYIDLTSLGDATINAIESAVAELRVLLAANVYGSTALANKYVKAPIGKNDERYLLWAAEDPRDSVFEPKKVLVLSFVDETNPSYHAIPRNISIEPTATWIADFNTFAAAYPSFDLFNCLVFSPTGSPSTPSENAFNPHLIDVIAGNNGYPAMSSYSWTGKPYWNENATGQELYDAIIAYLFG